MIGTSSFFTRFFKVADINIPLTRQLLLCFKCEKALGFQKRQAVFLLGALHSGGLYFARCVYLVIAVPIRLSSSHSTCVTLLRKVILFFVAQRVTTSV
jgi:hypothetical protein